MAQLLFLEAEDPDKDIFMYINSPGGSVSAGMAIYDTMQYIKCDVSTTCVGLAASMGAFLLAAGAKGKRQGASQQRNYDSSALGRSKRPGNGYRNPSQTNFKNQRKVSGHSRRADGKPLELLKADMERDFYMSSDEAKEYGLIDEVIPARH